MQLARRRPRFVPLLSSRVANKKRRGYRSPRLTLRATTASYFGMTPQATRPLPPAPHYRNARRWVPWLCAYSGVRVQEATQLRGDDIVQVDGIWAIRIRPDAGTQKNNSARNVPLHLHLVDQGFAKFAQDAGNAPMFYDGEAQAAQKKSDPTNPQKPLAVKTREHLAKWVCDIGVDDPELSPNHAWRHLFKELGDECGIPEKISDAITGHAPANVARSYGKARLEVMARELAKFPRFAA